MSQLIVLESDKLTKNGEQMENDASVSWGEKKERKKERIRSRRKRAQEKSRKRTL